MDRWAPLLDRDGVDLLGPRGGPHGDLIDLGHATPEAALHSAAWQSTGGPLLVAVNDAARATNTGPALAALRTAELAEQQQQLREDSKLTDPAEAYRALLEELTDDRENATLETSDRAA